MITNEQHSTAADLAELVEEMMGRSMAVASAAVEETGGGCTAAVVWIVTNGNGAPRRVAAVVATALGEAPSSWAEFESYGTVTVYPSRSWLDGDNDDAHEFTPAAFAADGARVLAALGGAA